MTAKIDEKTSISLFAILGITPVLVGGVVWLSSLGFRDDALAETVKKVEIKQKEIDSVISDVHARVIRIEEKVNYKNKECSK